MLMTISPLFSLQVITDANNSTVTSPTSVNVAGPPTIDAPPKETINSTSPTGATFVLEPPTSEYCGFPPCNVSVLFNNTLYPVGSTVQLPVGTTQLTYIITDSKGQTAQDVTDVTVLPPPTITAPADVSINAYNATNAPVTLQAPESSYCGVPNCTIKILVGGVPYNVGDTVTFPVGNTTVTYQITDSAGQTATDTEVINVYNSATYVTLGGFCANCKAPSASLAHAICSTELCLHFSRTCDGRTATSFTE